MLQSVQLNVSNKENTLAEISCAYAEIKGIKVWIRWPSLLYLGMEVRTTQTLVRVPVVTCGIVTRFSRFP